MPKVANYNVSLKCFLRNDNGEILVLKTSEDSSFNGKYDFPGGRIDENEFETDYIDILKREIFEETGIKNSSIKKKVLAIGRHKVLVSERKTVKEDNYIFYIFFEGFLDSEENIVISHEHDSFKWIKLDKIILEEYFMSGYLEAVKMYLSK